MSYVIPAYSYDDEEAAPQITTLPSLRFVPRAKHQWALFLLPTVICMLSWLLGGVPVITDIGFLLLTILLAACLFFEFYRFPVRFGIGGLILFGGSLCWFCQDYFTHWFAIDFNDPMVALMPAWVIAKAAALHCLFIMMLAVGLSWQIGRPLEKLLPCLPDPGDNRFYFFLVLVMFSIGLSPFFIFNAEPPFLAMYHMMFGALTGEAVKLTVFRDGNLNYSWGGYVAQIMQVGQVGCIFAMMYALLISRSFIERCLCVLMWLFWLAVAFNSDRRGEVAFFFMPLISLVFIKYQARAAVMFKTFSLRAYVICGTLTFLLLALVQFQGEFRGVGLQKGDISQIQIVKNQGNTMFSEGLKAYELIPNTVPFFRDKYPGQAVLQPIPQTVLDFFVGMIPRALWNDKPVDALWKWYNEIIMHTSDGTKGTTIAHGLVGTWYFTYGIAGVLEGGVLVGVLMGVSERALQHSEGRPLGMLYSLGFATWLFRTFRDWIYIDLYSLVIGAIGLYLLILLMRPFFGGAARANRISQSA